ncbi:MAG: aminotransferase class I/II-fold pyridoxal phosphate-dependent enzyme [Alistipes sp.]|nr:aminotransferase class I/II-fold pyridoxal phosphate-dependent enzyme [Alistipes sp.]
MKLEVAKRLGKIEEYYFSKKNREIDQMRAEGHDVISLGIGSPDLPPHPEVIATLGAEATKPNCHGYQSYKGAPILREAFSRWYKKYYGVELNAASEILPLIGSKEGIMHICMTYLNEGDRVLLPNPGYPTYTSAVNVAGGVPVGYRLRAENGWMPDFDELEGYAKEGGVKLMIANYPQMPTGAMPKEGIFEKLVDFARRNNILLVHDNPYSFLRNTKPVSILSVPGAKDVALELNSLSKSHCMAGWRVGMIGGAKERLEEILRFKSNMDSGMFYPMQAAAARALDLGDEWFSELNKIYAAREKKAYAIMDRIGCTYDPKQAGLFVWGRLPEGDEDCFAFSDRILYGCNVFITPGGIFGSEGMRYIRISLCAPEEKLQCALDRISNFL